MPMSSPSIAKLAPAWVQAQAELQHVRKRSRGQVGQNRNYRYADLASTVDAVKPILARHGLSFVQGFQPANDGVIVTTTLLHESGEWLRDEGLRVPASQQNAQQYGSAATYARRYGLTAFLGLATDDDDGRAASAPPEPVTARATPQPTNVADKALSAAERGELIELALTAGYTQAQAASTVAKLTRSKAAAFRKHCTDKAGGAA